MKFSKGFNFKSKGLFQKVKESNDDYSEYEYINLPTQLVFLRGLYYEDFFGELLVDRLPCNVYSQAVLRDIGCGINGTPDFLLSFAEDANIEDLICDFCLGLNVFKKKKRDSGLMHVSSILQGDNIEEFWQREAKKNHVSKKEPEVINGAEAYKYTGKSTILELKTKNAKDFLKLKTAENIHIKQLVFYRYLLEQLKDQFEVRNGINLGELENDLYLIYLCDQKNDQVQNSAKYFKINYLRYKGEIMERVNRSKAMKEKYIK